jgi:hypothetical protein
VSLKKAGSTQFRSPGFIESLLHELEPLAGFLGFCAPAVQLGRVFLRSFWSYIAALPRDKSEFIKRRIFVDPRCDLAWWHDLLPDGMVCAFSTIRPATRSLCTRTHQALDLVAILCQAWDPLVQRSSHSNAFSIPFTRSFRYQCVRNGSY